MSTTITEKNTQQGILIYIKLEMGKPILNNIKNPNTHTMQEYTPTHSQICIFTELGTSKMPSPANTHTWVSIGMYF